MRSGNEAFANRILNTAEVLLSGRSGDEQPLKNVYDRSKHELNFACNNLI
jgi:hypothetical protein